ncbi:hypothetical protein AU255_15985 [Methyloprofundus sedimenti]|uniref:Zinc-finger domain-containing protein n=1 Tax=Methyloprofundus sedimenti TaxID=1420851 RepID=A0A1V8M2B7_9GAMM|nr:hypothetical protein [Methyloprofundus sedimenti]OQK15710.1 hypothetical protein AU255_15985 [Methyloprofundus sedimenti]
MYKCKEIIELTSQNMDTTLPWATRMELKLHYLICKTCLRYARQLGMIQKALGDMDGHTVSCQLPEAARQRIAKKLQQAKETSE